MMLENLSFLIVCPDQEARHRLRTVLKTFVYKGRLDYERSLRFAFERVVQASASEPYDLLFLASSFGKMELSNFAKKLQAESTKKIPPMVVFMNDQMHEKSSEIAALYVDGISGFIAEPYTSDQLINLVTTVNQQVDLPQNDGLKQKKALEYMLLDAKKHVDDLWRLACAGEDPRGYALKELKATSGHLRRLAEEHPEVYQEVIVNVFERAQPPTAAELQRKVKKVQKQIIHPGSIVRRMMEERGLSAERLLAIVRIDPQDFIGLLKEEKALDRSMARELSRTLGMTPSDWIKLQTDYDALAKKNAPAAPAAP